MAGEDAPPGATTFTVSLLMSTTSSLPPSSTKYTDEESADHCSEGVPPPVMATTWCSPVSKDPGVDGVGEGVGGGVAGGCVTKGMLDGAASGCLPAAVLADGAIVTLYCVFGARFPLVG